MAFKRKSKCSIYITCGANTHALFLFYAYKLHLSGAVTSLKDDNSLPKGTVAMSFVTCRVMNHRFEIFGQMCSRNVL